ncbi:DegT/DnrJ/EryC1/StrS family aminotransferase [Streptomyces sp. HNM0575]|uniref:DegT/DnrJ/EryC1/StrS family aminotransferase n=1 Tax=Streptomyces sp. HNM0575 TaxID=2716338 RepID=UPI0032164136
MVTGSSFSALTIGAMSATEMTGVGVGSGDEVVVPAFGGAEVAGAVRAVGARPVFADIDPLSFCLSPAAVEAAVTDRTVAIAPVHLFGHPADMVCLREVAQRRGLKVIDPDPGPSVVSVDATRRRQFAEYLERRLRGVVIPTVAMGVQHSFDEYVVRVPGNGRPDRDAFKSALRARGVACYVPVKTPAHRTTEFRSDVWLPESERAAAETLALPLETSMTKRELHRLVSACNGLGGLLLDAAC